ncbi:Hsp20/alpha crystallin family protein [Aquisalibacillus elongatus]|uniref:HSP20 family protein n=1 Tax=Aquisalibacillus elongatus TaxID=485577 RepID=A0A3N5B555_9BACI|nr:Hsp20/alpha crystallin family protein [Aquisalibacillus elongatus]RPF50690.1 HSP20 family protein [Aquisalibacillus elongatus]
MDSFKHMHEWRQNIDRFFGESFWNEFDSILKPNIPQINIYRKDYEILCVINIPGIQQIKQIRCEIDGYHLRLQGEIELPAKGYELIQEEIIQGSFNRAIELPYRCREDKVHARYEHGLVFVKLYKDVHDSNKSKTISIEEGEQ